jgi:RNA polymerase sigma-70 factor, ECF subfamily
MVLDGTERELIEACQRGEREGFRALFELHKDRVYSIALHYASDESSAMDIAQATFVKLFSSIQTFRGEASFESWLYRVVVNSCFDHQRSGGGSCRFWIGSWKACVVPPKPPCRSCCGRN